MSLERYASALISADRIHSLQEESGADQKEATKAHILEVHEADIAGHDTLESKSDPDDIMRDGLMRSQNLERLYRGYLYVNKNQDDEGNVVVDDAVDPDEDELLSPADLYHGYGMIRERHNKMYREGRGETKTVIPDLKRSMGRTFIAEQVRGGWLELVPKDRRLEDVDFKKEETSKILRFPPSEFLRTPGEVEQEKKVLKQAAFSLLINERKDRVDISGSFEDAWFSASDLVAIYIGLEANCKYAGEVGMYFSLTSAQAYIREHAENYGLEQTIVHKTYEVNGKMQESEEPIYRQLPLAI